MKGYKKRLLAIAFTMILVMSNVLIASAEGKATMIQRQEAVEGHSPITAEKTTNATLNVKRTDDTFKVYDLTKITWDDSTGVLNATIEWNDAVKTFLAGNADFSGDQFSTPEKLGAADNESDVIRLLNAMREDATLMAALDASYLAAYHTSTADVNAGNSTVDAVKTPVRQAGVTPNMVGSEDNQVFNNAYTITGLEYGLYFVDAQGTTREYQPVMVNLMPVQTGPTGNWYIKNNLSASLKYEDINVTKTINRNTQDVVREGELVSFEIGVEVPQYTKDAGGNYLSGSSLFNGFDIMEKGYSLIATSAKIYYYDAAGKMYHPTAQITLDSSGNMTVTDTEQTYSANVAANSYVYYLTSNSAENVFYSTPTETAGTVKFWGNVNGELIDLGRYTDDNTASYTAVLNTLNQKRTAAGLATLSGTVAKRDATQSIISIKFDYTKLMNPETYNTASNTEGFTVPDRYVVTYDAQVNSSFIVGDDTNTNRVTVSYVGDSTGTIEIAEAEVKAWTYAANVKKIDGTTGDFLEGATFDLYRLDTVYCGGASATTAPTEGDYGTYRYYTDAEGIRDYNYSNANWSDVLKKAVQYNLTQQGTTDTAAIEAKVNEVLTALSGGGGYETADVFSKKYEPLTGNAEYMALLQKWVLPKVESGAMLYQAIPVKVSGCDDHPGVEHYHIEYYSTMWTGIESAAVADGDQGVTLVGLDPNTYLLIEKQAPDGYNKMTGALQFSINQYNSEQYTAAGNSYKGFIRDDSQNEEDGIYDITVENFQGLQLPSTGGMGTLLFTIIGICIMFAAIVIIVMKSRKRQYDYQ